MIHTGEREKIHAGTERRKQDGSNLGDSTQSDVYIDQQRHQPRETKSQDGSNLGDSILSIHRPTETKSQHASISHTWMYVCVWERDRKGKRGRERK